MHLIILIFIIFVFVSLILSNVIPVETNQLVSEPATLNNQAKAALQIASPPTKLATKQSQALKSSVSDIASNKVTTNTASNYAKIDNARKSLFEKHSNFWQGSEKYVGKPTADALRQGILEGAKFIAVKHAAPKIWAALGLGGTTAGGTYLYEIANKTEVARECNSDSEIRLAYLVKARGVHPDRNKDHVPEATKAFQKLTASYTHLKDEAGRRNVLMNSQPSKEDCCELWPELLRGTTGDYFTASSRFSGGEDYSFYSGSSGSDDNLKSDEAFGAALHQVLQEFISGNFETIIRLILRITSAYPELEITNSSLNGLLYELRNAVLVAQSCWGNARFEIVTLSELMADLNRLSMFDVLGRTKVSIKMLKIAAKLPLDVDKQMEKSGPYSGALKTQRENILVVGKQLLDNLEKIESSIESLENVFGQSYNWLKSAIFFQR